MRFLKSALVCGLIFVSGAMTSVSAKTLSFAYGHPSGSFLDQGAKAMADHMTEFSDGSVKIRTYPLSLLSLAETSQGLAIGLADIGSLMTTMFPAEYPHANLVMETSMVLLEEDIDLEKQGVLYGGVMAEFIVNHCPECLDEFSKANSVYTSATGSTSYALSCTTPVREMSDFRGLRIRVSGAYWSRWSEAMGAVPITMSGNEMFEALSQGAIDCITISVPDVFNFGMGELVSDITLGVPGGNYVSSFSQVNKDAWGGLTESERTAFLKAAAHGMAKIAWMYEEGQNNFIKSSENGDISVSFHRPSDEVLDRTRDFVREDIAVMMRYYERSHRVERGEEMVSKIRELVDEWKLAISSIDSEEELANLYWERIFSEVDVSTYGL